MPIRIGILQNYRSHNQRRSLQNEGIGMLSVLPILRYLCPLDNMTFDRRLLCRDVELTILP